MHTGTFKNIRLRDEAQRGLSGTRNLERGAMTTIEPDQGSWRATPVIDFSNYEGTYSGIGTNGRQWRITPTFIGWRLEFRDSGDLAATYAGTHATVALAQMEAAR